MLAILHEFIQRKLTSTNGLPLILTATLTAIASEVKVVPFYGEDFRFGLGSIVFFLFILIFPPASFWRTGITTGITVVCFRLFGDLVMTDLSPWTSLLKHLPAFLFYLLFSLGFGLVKIERYKSSPLLLGVLAAGLEFTANSLEHFWRYYLPDHADLGFKDWALLVGIALFRSYFVVGLYSSITVSEQRRQMQEMLGVGSELYVETLYLQKSMNNIEQITASSHELYRKLKKENLQELSVQALHISQEIHEVKKDAQRILSGLSKIYVDQRSDRIFLSDVLGFVMTANQNYSELLKKKVIFDLSVTVDFETGEQIPLLALLNNLVANAVEAIEKEGQIHLRAFEDSEYTCFVVQDSGKGILTEDVPFIFELGYTTKYSDQGVAATGIGLSHVQQIVYNFHGQIQVESSAEGTVFTIQIPTREIRKRVE
ncbi:two component sensor histidine kinase [Bacillus sp. FJAT-27231]|uniref:ATP-binding protein n=1 Tax=Bacillus sp. FJAT-27231 TaxID=1679168 RepID=UPI0006710180|nr:ATP-binding protein [Bacillus sp. FJAT-27231]KMY53088.1 two component sensor histidine kinase [Bacillus sp. FJAT-27231]